MIQNLSSTDEMSNREKEKTAPRPFSPPQIRHLLPVQPDIYVSLYSGSG